VICSRPLEPPACSFSRLLLHGLQFLERHILAGFNAPSSCAGSMISSDGIFKSTITDFFFQRLLFKSLL
jgi:hypothetical protein